MLTVDYDRLDVHAGMHVADLGCGAGRHSFEAFRRGAHVVAVDRDPDALAQTAQWLTAMAEAGQAPHGATARVVRGDVLSLPFPDASFDRVIISEVLEHIPADTRAIAEVARVLRPGGLAAVTVPRYGPERVCWALSRQYHEVPGGHVRIYRADQLEHRLARAGLVSYGRGHAHALHAPYWWLKCALGVERDPAVVRAYHRLLVWDLTAHPPVTRAAERVLNPVLGKSFVTYVRKARP
jgi:SAM-dependent methyltransferase